MTGEGRERLHGSSSEGYGSKTLPPCRSARLGYFNQGDETVDEPRLTADHINELRRIEARRAELTRALDNGSLQFKSRYTQERHCDVCDVLPHEYQRLDGTWATWPVSIIVIEGETLCRDCFISKWTLPHRKNPGGGSPHSAIPTSQMRYDGGRFTSGEW